MQKRYVMKLQSSHREEADGTHSIMIVASGIPSLEMAQDVSDWMRDVILERVDEIGVLEEHGTPVHRQ